MLETENRLQVVHRVFLGEVAVCPCLDPVTLPAGNSQKSLESVFIMGLPNSALNGANKPASAKKTDKTPHSTNQSYFISEKENLTHLSAASLS